MPLSATNFITKGPVLHADLLQFFNLFTGVMLDQPVTFKNTLTLGGNQGSSTVPLKIYGAVGQTSHLLDLYADTGQAQPGFGFGAAGNFGWGPGGASPQDTFLSRVATQNGHASDTAGLLIQPYLEVAGPIQANSYQFANGAALTGPGANPFQLTVNQDLRVNRSVGVGGPPVAGGSGPVLSLSVGSATNFQSMLGVGQQTDVIKGVVGTSTAAAMTLGPTMQAVANSANVYGGYWVPFWNAGGFTGLYAKGLFLGPQPVPAGFISNIGLHVSAPSGATNQNLSIYSEGPCYFAGATGIGLEPNSTTAPNVRLLIGGNVSSISNYAAQVQVGGNVNAAQPNTVIYGEYFQPTLNPSGQANINTTAMIIAPVTSGSPYDCKGLLIGQVSGGTHTNYALHINTPGNPNGYAIVVDGGAISFPANSLSAACLFDNSIATSKLAAQAVNSIQNAVAAPSGGPPPGSWGPAPEPFGTTGLVFTTVSGQDWLEIHVTVTISSSATGAPCGAFIGLGRDGVLWQNLGLIVIQNANFSNTGTFSFTAADSGTHRYTIWWQAALGSGVIWSTGIYSSLNAKVIHR